MSKSKTKRSAETDELESSRKQVKLTETITIDSDGDDTAVVTRTCARPRKSRAHAHNQREIRHRLGRSRPQSKHSLNPSLTSRFNEVFEAKWRESMSQLWSSWDMGYLPRPPTYEEVCEQMMRNLSKDDPIGLDAWTRAVWSGGPESGGGTRLVGPLNGQSPEMAESMYGGGISASDSGIGPVGIFAETANFLSHQYRSDSHLPNMTPTFPQNFDTYGVEASCNFYQSTNWYGYHPAYHQNTNSYLLHSAGAFNTVHTPGLLGSLGIPHNIMANEMQQAHLQSYPQAERGPPRGLIPPASSSAPHRQRRRYARGKRPGQGGSGHRQNQSGDIHLVLMPTLSLRSASRPGRAEPYLNADRTSHIRGTGETNAGASAHGREREKQRISPVRSSDSTISPPSSEEQ